MEKVRKLAVRLNYMAIFMALLPPASAAADIQVYNNLLNSIDPDKPMWTRTTQGFVRDIDLAERTTVIGGYSYFVGPATAETPIRVVLAGTTAGSFELLRNGMRVEVVYVDFGDARIAFEITELTRQQFREH